jgi:DNA-binding transcriptional LysR family regulator
MTGMDLDKLKLFHAVVEAGSFTQAAEDQNLNQSTVSRQINALEDELGATLFQRHARGLNLTEQGELLHRATKQIFCIVEDTKAALLDSRETPRGAFKVTATVGFGTYWLMPRLREFVELYPDIELQVILDDRELDLSEREADVAIRMRQPVEHDLIMRKLFDVRYHLYASADYLARRGAPKAIEDLDQHSVITYGDAPQEIRGVNWLRTAGRDGAHPRKPALAVNHLGAMMYAVESGAGIASMPDYLAHSNPKLVRVLPDVQGPNFDVHLCYPVTMKGSKRVTVFRDFLLRHSREWCF